MADKKVQVFCQPKEISGEICWVVKREGFWEFTSFSASKRDARDFAIMMAKKIAEKENVVCDMCIVGENGKVQEVNTYYGKDVTPRMTVEGKE